MKTETFTCKFHDMEFQYIITSEYPNIIEAKRNLGYLLRKRDNELRDNEIEFPVQHLQGKSNNKAYKEYEDKKGKYIKYTTGTSCEPKFLKIYKD